MKSNVPRATYRFQFHESFPLSRARSLVPYLRDLGISHIYASPVFKARPHSTHGYDTCDFNQLNPELGTEAELGELIQDLRAHGMGLVIDIVPNHMGIGGPENRWWWDVLARGPESPYAKFFDIDWESSDSRLRGKVLVPVLGDRYHHVLEKHELRLDTGGEAPLLRYGENVFPLNAASLQTSNATPEELNANPAALDALMERQFYRLSWYGAGDAELNYRRFFNITSLPALCMEDEEVFAKVFGLTRQWLEHGWLDGLRVDHPDGLRDPAEFLLRLRKIAPMAWIVVEKILEPGEFLPRSWPVAGTTGYDFLNCASGLLVDSASEKAFTDLSIAHGGTAQKYPEFLRDKKRLVLQSLFAAEVEHLAHLLLRIAAADWRHRDFTHAEMSAVLIEWLACFPVYRTYLSPATGSVSEADVKQISGTADKVRQAKPAILDDLCDFLCDLLLLKQKGEVEGEFVARFQQLSSAAMAKGAEDTAFYCFNRFVALNEVGGDPVRFGVSLEEFHGFCQRQQSEWPDTMLASSTHDTKRSEDVRARLSLLSEMPEDWSAAVARWSALARPHHKGGWPDANAEYLFYQNLAGAWPLPPERAMAYMEKASHEAKEHTRWSKPNPEYDSALHDFVAAVLADPKFTSEVDAFVRPLLRPALVNSLVLTLLKLAAPGVPDFYQGTELVDLSLVDPDNRHPVDYAARQRLLTRAGQLSAVEAWHEWESGLPKLWLIRRVLNLRARQPELFDRSAAYAPLSAEGGAVNHVVAFRRGENLIAVAPRFLMKLNGRWNDTTLPLPEGKWRNCLTEEAGLSNRVNMADLTAKFPVALLVREGIS